MTKSNDIPRTSQGLTIEEAEAALAAADGLLAIMLANIDHAMGCTDLFPAVFNVMPSELVAWANAVEAYESERFKSAYGED